jgi:hypothetical protein
MHWNNHLPPAKENLLLVFWLYEQKVQGELALSQSRTDICQNTKVRIIQISESAR